MKPPAARAGDGGDSSRSFRACGRASACADAPASFRPRRRAVGQRPARGGFNRYFRGKAYPSRRNSFSSLRHFFRTLTHSSK